MVIMNVDIGNYINGKQYFIIPISDINTYESISYREYKKESKFVFLHDVILKNINILLCECMMIASYETYITPIITDTVFNREDIKSLECSFTQILRIIVTTENMNINEVAKLKLIYGI